MSIVEAVVLAVIQGLTEFFPVSSSGHLVLARWAFGWDTFADAPNLELAFDVAVHLGTLTGAIAYFRRDLVRYAVAGLGALVDRERRTEDDARVAWLLLLTAVPGALVGVFLADLLQIGETNVALVAVMLIVFGLALAWADRRRGERPATAFGLRDAVAMGVGQAMALQPGVSRSGVTMTVARTVGFSRDAAVRLSFLMSVPIIAGAGLFSIVDVARTGGIPADFRVAFAVGFTVAAVTGWGAVWATLRIVRTRTFDGFVIYRVVLGVVVLALLATPWR
ncbi:MAG: undecaprenyl-diphosphate phosphatase [Acidimicrobiales bacterium]